MSTAHGAVSKDYLPFQNALASLLLDEEQGRMVCDAILGRSVGSHSSVAATEELAAFFPSCSVPRTYAAVIHNWISTQMQPLLSYRPHHSFPSGTSSSSSSSSGGGSGVVAIAFSSPYALLALQDLGAACDDLLLRRAFVHNFEEFGVEAAELRIALDFLRCSLR